MTPPQARSRDTASKLPLEIDAHVNGLGSRRTEVSLTGATLELAHIGAQNHGRYAHATTLERPGAARDISPVASGPMPPDNEDHQKVPTRGERIKVIWDSCEM